MGVEQLPRRQCVSYCTVWLPSAGVELSPLLVHFLLKLVTQCFAKNAPVFLQKSAPMKNWQQTFCGRPLIGEQCNPEVLLSIWILTQNCFGAGTLTWWCSLTGIQSFWARCYCSHKVCYIVHTRISITSKTLKEEPMSSYWHLLPNSQSAQFLWFFRLFVIWGMFRALFSCFPI